MVMMLMVHENSDKKLDFIASVPSIRD